MLPTRLDAGGDAAALADSDLIELTAVLRPTGLTAQFRRLSSLGAIIGEFGKDPHERRGLLALAGVGEYVADTVLVYAFEQPTFPKIGTFKGF